MREHVKSAFPVARLQYHFGQLSKSPWKKIIGETTMLFSLKLDRGERKKKKKERKSKTRDPTTQLMPSVPKQPAGSIWRTSSA